MIHYEIQKFPQGTFILLMNYLLNALTLEKIQQNYSIYIIIKVILLLAGTIPS